MLTTTLYSMLCTYVDMFIYALRGVFFQTLDQLQKNVYPKLSGDDLDMLQLYYTTLQSCCVHGARSEVSMDNQLNRIHLVVYVCA